MERNGKLTIQHEGRIKAYAATSTSSPPVTKDTAKDSELPPTPAEAQSSTSESVNGRPRRSLQKPRHLENYWIDNLRIDQLSTKTILGQNQVLGGGSVINLPETSAVEDLFGNYWLK